jgi:hypothetical protein
MDALLPDVVLHEAVQEERPGRAAMDAKAPSGSQLDRKTASYTGQKWHGGMP